jgi:hypothetical protein
VAVEPRKLVKRKKDLVAMEKDGLFSREGYGGTKSLARSSSKETGKQRNPEDVQKTNVQLATQLPKPKLKLNQQLFPAEKHEPFSLESCGLN